MMNWKEFQEAFEQLDRDDRQAAAIMIKSCLATDKYRQPAAIIRADFMARDPDAAEAAKISGDFGDLKKRGSGREQNDYDTRGEQMTKERMIELIKAQIEGEEDQARTEEEEAFLLTAWLEMTDEERDAYRATYAKEEGTLCNVVYSCKLDDLKATARTLEAIRTKCTDLFDEENEETYLEGSVEDVLDAITWAIREKQTAGKDF